jgi:hypothetical protein
MCSPLRRPVQPRPDPRSRLVLPHLEYAAGGLDPGPHAPPGDEGVGECGIREVDRNRVIQNAASAGRCESPTVRAAVRVQPIGDLGVPLAETSRRNADPERTRKRRSARVVIVRGLPGILCSLLVLAKSDTVA